MKYPIRILMCVLAVGLIGFVAQSAEASRKVDAVCGAVIDTKCASEDCKLAGYEDVTVVVTEDMVCEKDVTPLTLVNHSGGAYTMTLAGQGYLITGDANKAIVLQGGFITVDRIMVEGFSTGLDAYVTTGIAVINSKFSAKQAINADYVSNSSFYSNVLNIGDPDFYAITCIGCKGVLFYNNSAPNFRADCRVAGGVQFNLDKPRLTEDLNIVGGPYLAGNYWQDNCAAIDTRGLCKAKVVTDCGDVDSYPLAMMEVEEPIIAISKDVEAKLIELVPDAKAIVKKAEGISILANKIVESEEAGDTLKVLSVSAKAAGNTQALENIAKDQVPIDVIDMIKDLRAKLLEKKWDAMETLKAM